MVNMKGINLTCHQIIWEHIFIAFMIKKQKAPQLGTHMHSLDNDELSKQYLEKQPPDIWASDKTYLVFWGQMS